MKKILLIIPLALGIAVNAQTNTTKENDQTKTSTETKINGTSTLDGKAFKITLQARTTSDVNTPDSKNGVGVPSSTTSSNRNEDYNRTGNATSVNGNTTNTQSGSTGVESGTTYQSGSQTGNTTGTAPNSSAGNTMKNATPSSGGTTGVTTPVDNSVAGGTQTGTSVNTTGTVPQDKTVVATPQTTPAPTTQDPSAQTDNSMYEKSLDSRKAILRFDNGIIRSSVLKENKMSDCPYRVNNNEGSMYTFISNCKSTVGSARATWSGIVDGNSIRGTFSWTLDNGRTISYTFTGSKASEKDISADQELGMK